MQRALSALLIAVLLGGPAPTWALRPAGLEESDAQPQVSAALGQPLPANVLAAWTAGLQPLISIAMALGLRPEEITFQDGVLKFNAEAVLRRLANEPAGEIVPILGVTPVSGEGKTTTLIALTDAAALLGLRAAGDLRQPSQGPAWGGRKGGAVGAGYEQVVPGDLINLGLTGDFTTLNAIADKILAEFFNAVTRNRTRKLPGWSLEEMARIDLARAIDVQFRDVDRTLLFTGSFKEELKTPVEVGTVLTPAHELMAILVRARDDADFARRLGRMVIATRRDGSVVTVDDLDQLLKSLPQEGEPRGVLHDLMAYVRERKLLWSNLVMTMHGASVGALGGPFANTSLGTSAYLNTMALLRLVGRDGLVFKEFGFSVTEGGQKAFDDFFPYAGLAPRVAVVVATVKAAKQHGLENLGHHLKVVQGYGVTPVVAINIFPTDTAEEIAAIHTYVDREFPGVRVAESRAPGVGPTGSTAVVSAIQETLWESRKRGVPTFQPLLQPETQSSEEMIAILARRVYEASRVEWQPSARAAIDQLQAQGIRYPVVVSKTYEAIGDDPTVLGVPPPDSVIHVQRVTPMAGAGHLLIEIGVAEPVKRLPGLPATPTPFERQVLPPREASAKLLSVLDEAQEPGYRLVVPSVWIDHSRSFRDLLADLPSALSRAVILWDDGIYSYDLADLARRNPELTVVRGDETELAARLAQDHPLQQVGIIGHDRLNGILLRALRAGGISAEVTLVPIKRVTFTTIAGALGVPSEVLRQAGLEQRRDERYLASGM